MKKKTVKLWKELFEPTPPCYGKYPWAMNHSESTCIPCKKQKECFKEIKRNEKKFHKSLVFKI